MKVVDIEELNETFDTFWNEMQIEFFKIEVLQYYGEDDSPSLREWLAGNREKSLEMMRKDAKPWAEGKESVKKIRIHVVDYPLSEYIQWEIEHYKLINIPFVGEEIYLVNRKKIDGLKLPKGDTIIFDKKKAIVNIYNDNGVVIKAEIYEDEDIEQFLELRDDILNLPLEKIR
ncbi:MAG: hypothetical protein Q7S53_04315 [bacterium]|nr:hypothetical protein [bacterium]